MTAAADTQWDSVDLDDLQASAERLVGELNTRRQGLVLAAFRDKAAADQLGDLEHELADIESQLARIALARAEQERVDAQAITEAQDGRRAQALKAAGRLQARREKTAAAVDATAVAFVGAVAEYVAVATEQQQHLIAADREQAAMVARPRSYAIEACLSHAMRQARLPGDFLARMPAIRAPHRRPLAEADPRPVEKPNAVPNNRKEQ